MQEYPAFYGLGYTIIGIILFTGIGDLITKFVSPLAGNIWGLLILSLICAAPILSPLLGPGGFESIGWTQKCEGFQ